jgi:rod shape-determining protein MreD
MLTPMRWISFFVVALLAVVLQTTLAWRLRVAGITPDWILVFVVFFALHVKGLDALIAGWMLGLLASLESLERFGMLAIGYALVALAVYLVRDYMFRRHALTHFLVTLASGILLYGLTLASALTLSSLNEGVWGRQFVAGLLVALYSALWAPIVHKVLLYLGPFLGLELPRYSHARFARAA